MTGGAVRRCASRLTIAMLIACSGAALAQTTGTRDLTAETIRDRLASIEARTDIDTATRVRIAGLYKQALAEIERAAQLRRDSDDVRRRIGEAPAEVRRLERALEGLQRGAPFSADELAAIERATSDELDRQQARARDELDDAERRLADAERARDEAAARGQTLAAEQVRTRTALESARADVVAPLAAGQGTALSQATRMLNQAKLAVLQAQLERIENEIAYQPTLLRLRTLERDAAQAALERADARGKRLVAAAEQKRSADAATARKEADDAERKLTGEPAVLRELYKRNAELAAQVADTGLAADRALLELARLRTAQADLEQAKRALQRRAESHTLGREFAQTILDRMRQLPKPDQFARKREQRDPLVIATNEANLRAEREIAALADLPQAARNLVAGMADAPAQGAAREQLDAKVQEQLARERGLLMRLDEQQKTLLRALAEVEEAEVELADATRAAREELIGLLFWVPLNPIETRTFTQLAPALEWTFSPRNWSEAGTALVHEAQRRPLLPALAGIAFVLLVVFRGRIKRKLDALSPAAMPYQLYGVHHTLAALGLTVLLSLPGALLVWATGTLLERAPNAALFTQSLGGALIFTARIFLVMYGFSWLLDRRGVAVNHFRWDADTMRWLQRLLRRYAVVIVPLVFVTRLNTGFGPHSNAESLGRVAFMLLMAVVSLLVWRVFAPSSPLMQRFLAARRDTWTAKLHVVWLAILAGIPLVLAGLAATGFYFAAGYLFTRIIDTSLLVLAAVILYGLIALWVLVQRNRLIKRQVEEIAEQAAAEAESGETAQPRAPALDIAAIGDQTRQLLDLLITLLVLGGAWLIWRDAVPLLRVVGDFALWSYADSVDGEAVVQTLTLGGLVLAVLVGVVTVVMVRNIGALLDIVLLQRLGLQADATYAIKTVTRYAIAGIGILVATNILNVSWGKVQWLVAALGVGLGFGLQEIVANFVSGLIVLGERPIRIGDIVTVGDVSGTVARIRARATSVIDFDNKEVIIPNKAFITSQVTNWTLSNQTTRLLLKIGVAYGSDVEKTQAVLTEVVAGHPLVLREPGYSVFFTSFGDSALNFEIRAYVDSIDKRLRVLHDLNTGIERALREAGIEIPFPQRDLHIRTAPGLEHMLTATAERRPRPGAEKDLR